MIGDAGSTDPNAEPGPASVFLIPVFGVLVAEVERCEDLELNIIFGV